MEKGVSSIPEVSKRAEGPNEKCSSCSTAEGANVVLDEGVCDGVDAGDSTCLSLNGGGALPAGDTDEFSWQPTKLPDQTVWILGSGETKQWARQIATGKPRSFPVYQGMVL